MLIKYRSELDGLRAIAVLPVIAFHAGIEFFSGGFVGVDVFFVISGYLITTIIIQEKRAGSFSLLYFYERRARRIFPALFFMTSVTTLLSWLWMTPDELRDYSKSLIAVASFLSNFHFWLSVDYFSASSEFQPLLHTWSLAIEEQYYFIFPILLIVLWRAGFTFILSALVIIGIVSAILSHWGSTYWPDASFYLLHTRFWELLCGSLLAFGLTKAACKEFLLNVPQARDGLALLGILMILYSISSFDSGTPFPSLYTLVPVSGTALVILFADQGGVTSRILSQRILVGIGLISYSAYLWHQPIFSFARLRSAIHPSQTTMYILAALSLIIAFFSWKLIERPFRDRERFSRNSIAVMTVFFTSSMAALGLMGYLLDGADFRKAPSGQAFSELKIDERLRPNHGLGKDCNIFEDIASSCVTHLKPEILIWGDSLAMHLLPAIKATHPEARLLQVTAPRCGSIIGLAPLAPGSTVTWGQDCIARNERMLRFLDSNKSIRYALLSSEYSHYLPTHGSWRLVDKSGLVSPNFNDTLSSLMATLDALHSRGVRAAVVSPPPLNGTNVGFCLSRVAIFGLDRRMCDYAELEYFERRNDVIELLRAIETRYPVLWLEEVLCESGTCKSYLDDAYVYRDHQHLSYEGSVALGKRMDLLSVFDIDAKFDPVQSQTSQTPKLFPGFSADEVLVRVQ